MGSGALGQHGSKFSKAGFFISQHFWNLGWTLNCRHCCVLRTHVVLVVSLLQTNMSETMISLKALRKTYTLGPLAESEICPERRCWVRATMVLPNTFQKALWPWALGSVAHNMGQYGSCESILWFPWASSSIPSLLSNLDRPYG